MLNALQGNGGLLEEMFIRFIVNVAKWLIIKKENKTKKTYYSLELEKVNTILPEARLLIFIFTFLNWRN